MSENVAYFIIGLLIGAAAMTKLAHDAYREAVRLMNDERDIEALRATLENNDA